MAQYLDGENMKKIYKIFNPLTGLYLDAESKEDCIKIYSKIAHEFYLTHTHHAPYSIVEIAKNGMEVWRNANGDEILSPNDIKLRIKTVAERLPVNILGGQNG